MRLDDIDALIIDMIAEIDNNSDIINATLIEQSEKVGYDLSEAMNGIWGSDGSLITNVTSMVDKIYEYLETMIKQLDTIASKNVSTASKSSAAKSSSSSSSNNTDAIIAQMKANSAEWHTNKSAQGSLHEQNINLSNDLKKAGINVSYDKHTGKWKTDDGKNLYASGARRIANDEIAWTQEKGREFIIRPSDGAILTPLARNDSILNATASKNIWDMANSPTKFIKDNLKLDRAITPIGQNSQASYIQNLDNVVFNLPNVKNYEELLTEMQRDKNFEKLILSMSIDRLAGKSALSKGKALR